MNSILLTKEFFDYTVIEKAIVAFSSLSNIEYDDKQEYLEIFFREYKCEPDILAKEFENYCIDLLNKEKIW